MKTFKGKKNNKEKIHKMNSDLEKENIRLKVRLNLLKKYIIQSSIVNKTIQTELFERTESLKKVQELDSEIEDEEMI